MPQLFGPLPSVLYRAFLLLLLFTATGTRALAQETYPYNGVYDQRDGHYAFTGGTIHVSPEQTIENGALVIKDGKIVALYTTNADAHASYVSAAEERGYKVLELGHVIDNHWVQQIESKESDLTFVRVDSNTVDKLVERDEQRESVLSEEQTTAVRELFEAAAKEGDGGGSVQLEPLSPTDMPVVVTRNEFMRRMTEMQQFQQMGAQRMPEFYNLVVNTNHPLVAEKLAQAEGEERQAIAKQLVDLARLNQGLLKGKELADFVKRSVSALS